MTSSDSDEVSHAVSVAFVSMFKFADLAVKYHDQHGQWPSDPQQVYALSPEPDADLLKYCQTIRVEPTPEGLLVYDRYPSDRFGPNPPYMIKEGDAGSVIITSERIDAARTQPATRPTTLPAAPAG